MTTSGAHIYLEGISKRFGSVQAVENVSLEIEAGEFFTLLGPSGSGKSTLLHLLAGFESIDSGKIHLDQADISALPPFQREIGVVFQSYALFPHLSVFENVAFPLRVRKKKDSEVSQRVDAVLASVHLSEYGSRRISQLSGGQQQRVALARAVVFEPRLLLMDEPLSALDAKLRKAMQSEIRQFQRNLDITVVYVTHDQQEALAMSDRVAVMRDGRIEQAAAPNELYEHPRTRFVGDFLGDANVLSAEVVSSTNGTATVQAGEHSLSGFTLGTLKPNDSVHLLIRPERIAIASNNSATGQNAVDGVVLATEYGGDHNRVSVDIGNGNVLVALLRVDGGHLPTVGETVTLAWESACTSILTE